SGTKSTESRSETISFQIPNEPRSGRTESAETVGCVGVFLVTDARSATVDLLIGSGSIRGALPFTCVSAAREAGQLDVVLRRVETGADPAYDLAVDYDRKTASGPPSEAQPTDRS